MLVTLHRRHAIKYPKDALTPDSGSSLQSDFRQTFPPNYKEKTDHYDEVRKVYITNSHCPAEVKPFKKKYHHTYPLERFETPPSLLGEVPEVENFHVPPFLDVAQTLREIIDEQEDDQATLRADIWNEVAARLPFSTNLPLRTGLNLGNFPFETMQRQTMAPHVGDQALFTLNSSSSGDTLFDPLERPQNLALWLQSVFEIRAQTQDAIGELVPMNHATLNTRAELHLIVSRQTTLTPLGHFEEFEAGREAGDRSSEVIYRYRNYFRGRRGGRNSRGKCRVALRKWLQKVRGIFGHG